MELKLCEGNSREVGDEPGNYGKGNLGLGFLGPVADPEVRQGEASGFLGVEVFLLGFGAQCPVEGSRI